MFSNLKARSKAAVSYVRNNGYHAKLVAVACASGAGVVGSATAALATGDPITDMFTALNVSSLTTNITTLLTSGIGIMVLFVGYRYLKKGARTI